MRKVLLVILLVALAGSTADTASRRKAVILSEASVRLADVPHVQQRPDFCGEACAEMVLRWRGHDLDQDAVFSATAVDPALGRGAYTAELGRGLEALGFDVGPIWYQVQVVAADAELRVQWLALLADLRQGIPSIVCMHYDDTPETTEHFRLVVGYDAARDEVLYHEPAKAAAAYRRMALAHFLELWPLKYEPATWTVIRLRMELDGVPAPMGAEATARADLAQHVRALKPRVPEGFSLVVQPPFVVLGDEDAAVLRQRSQHTVQWAVTHLKRDFFARDPAQILDIWLFKDARSYQRHTRSLFGHSPSTPYGYYSDSAHALIMNIETGGGTLVHEIVHPFVEANFPASPAWFNEGLGSLYEQCAEDGGHIRGLTNWRLPGLQQAIRAGTLPSFETLTHTSSRAFYDEDPGSNYAQARYLLYYLQEKKLLRRYYQRFVAGQAEDPTGYRTLQQVLEVRDMKTFQQEWQHWVLGLHFPPSA
ncbi:MAG: papain-like cysteine protease family protein [Pseudomonadota bacterium]